MDKNFSTVSIYSDYSKQIAFTLDDGEIRPFGDENILIKVDKTIDNFINLVDFRIDFRAIDDHLEFWISFERISSVEFYAKPKQKNVLDFTEDV